MTNHPIAKAEEFVTRKYAAQVAAVYMGSFPNQAHEPSVFAEQLISWLVGKPKAVIKHMNDPNTGAVPRSDRPCFKTLNKWFNDWTGRASERTWQPKQPDPGPEVPPDEVREEDVKRWQAVKAQINKVVSATDASKPPPRAERTDGYRLLQGLQNLHEMRKALGVSDAEDV